MIRRAARGFTLIELMVVMTLVAIATAAITLALRDPTATQLEREGERLAALLETARAEARVAGLRVVWMPTPDASDAQFRFQGLPQRIQLPGQWLAEAPGVEIQGARQLVLGPEPMIGAQRLRLRLGREHLDIATDGLGPFAVVHEEPSE